VNEAYPTDLALHADAGRGADTARAASVEELSTLYHEGYHRFVRVAEAITRDPEEARDAVQEGFSNALREVDRFKGRGSFEGWVWRCVVNAARMSRRRSRRLAFPSFQTPALAPDNPNQPEPKLLEQVARLPERQRLVLFLRYFADLSYDGIAEALRVSPGTVAATLNSAHRTLRRELEEAGDD
jgi:RNA polymerase sigma factor (sigma-70 family)